MASQREQEKKRKAVKNTEQRIQRRRRKIKSLLEKKGKTK